MNKRGQFYLVAAIIIVFVLAGIASVRTYAIVRPEPRVIQDLGSELKEETSRIVDYGIYNTDVDLNLLLDSFTDEEFAPYFLQKTGETGIVFIYGDKEDLSAVQYDKELTGTISATIGTGVVNWQEVSPLTRRISVSPTSSDSLEVEISGRTFEFDLKDNEMFYFVIIKEEGDDTYVERN
tara:strand:+ start:2247 stop:2786 length:540 start_codon:yes stop_codon:yes gene_type:complete